MAMLTCIRFRHRDPRWVAVAGGVGKWLVYFLDVRNLSIAAPYHILVFNSLIRIRWRHWGAQRVYESSRIFVPWFVFLIDVVSRLDLVKSDGIAHSVLSVVTTGTAILSKFIISVVILIKGACLLLASISMPVANVVSLLSLLHRYLRHVYVRWVIIFILIKLISILRVQRRHIINVWLLLVLFDGLVLLLRFSWAQRFLSSGIGTCHFVNITVSIYWLWNILHFNEFLISHRLSWHHIL